MSKLILIIKSIASVENKLNSVLDQAYLLTQEFDQLFDKEHQWRHILIKFRHTFCNLLSSYDNDDDDDDLLKKSFEGSLGKYRNRLFISAYFFSCIYFACIWSICIRNSCAYKQAFTVIDLFLFNLGLLTKSFSLIFNKSISLSLLCLLNTLGVFKSDTVTINLALSSSKIIVADFVLKNILKPKGPLKDWI